MSTITDNAAADVTENPTGIVTATETNQIKKIRQSPLNITVVLPNNRRILIPSVNPTEPTSYLKQTLQEYQESAQYTSYTFETSDKVTISDYIEIANYGPVDEEESTMVVHLVPAQYDVKKSRLQLKRVREMIAYPPSTKGAHSVSKTGAESPINVVNKEEAAASLNVVCPAVDTEEHSKVDPKNEERSLLESAAADVIGEKSDIKNSEAIDSTAAAIDPITERDLPLEGIVEVTTNKSDVSSPALLSPDNTITADDVKRKEKEMTLEVVAGASADDANSPSNESKDGNSLEGEKEVVVEEEVKPMSVTLKSSIVLDDDGIKVTGVDAVDTSETKQLSKLPEKITKLPSLKSIFCPVLLSEFFAETLLRVGANDGANNHRKTVESGVDNKDKLKIKSPSECIKSVSASGWNPPPLARKLQGDLLYIEAVTGAFSTSSSASSSITSTPSFTSSTSSLFFTSIR